MSPAAEDFIKIIGKGAFGIVELWQQRFNDEKRLSRICDVHVCTGPRLNIPLWMMSHGGMWFKLRNVKWFGRGLLLPNEAWLQ